jgi:ribosomal protein L39E
MVRAYLSGKTQAAASVLIGCANRVLRAELQRRKIKTRNHSEAARKYKFNECFFDKIDTEEKAYWLGFLTADATLTTAHNRIKLDLASRDKTHLYKFRRSLQANHPIPSFVGMRKGRACKYSQISLISAHMVRSLGKLGVTDRKSFTVTPCMLIPYALRVHYWRGLVDGDGHVIQRRGDARYTHKIRPKKRLEFGLCGNYAMVAGFAVFVAQRIPNHASILPSRSIFRIRYFSKEVVRAVVRLLYYNATISLARKNNMAKKILNGKP